MAAAVTITEVYVVSCKEQLPLEDALARYPWVSGVFTKKQVHPMLGKAACPLYKRTLPFPVKGDIMDFDYDVVTSGVAKLKQRHENFFRNLLEYVYVSHVALAALAGYLCYCDYLDGQSMPFSWVLKVAPYAGTFYSIRVVTDWWLGVQWHPLYFYSF